MKKIKLFLMAVTFGLAMVACSNTDSMIDDLEKAVKKGNMVEAAKISSKLDEKELTNEQALRITKIMSNAKTNW